MSCASWSFVLGVEFASCHPVILKEYFMLSNMATKHILFLLLCWKLTGLSGLNSRLSDGWQPQEIGITSHQNANELTESELINQKVSQEMFDSIIREVVEEIGVPAASIVSISLFVVKAPFVPACFTYFDQWVSFLFTINILILMQQNPLFIGISRRELNVRPAAFFFIKCSLDSKEIQKLYLSAQDGYESTQLYAVSMVSLNIIFLR